MESLIYLIVICNINLSLKLVDQFRNWLKSGQGEGGGVRERQNTNS